MQRKTNSCARLGIQEEHPEWETMTASVIGRDPSDQFYSFTIDKGTLDGVSYQDPVITSDGLVGIVSEVGPVFAKVTTILDVRLNVACQDVRTQDVATVSGDIALAENGQCRMSLIPRESGVAKGDIIQTAGTSGLYPQGIVIGRIQEVAFEPQGTMMYAVIEPMLTEEELAALKRGRNISSIKPPKNGSMQDYRRATGLECLFGYLYLQGKIDRINQLFLSIEEKLEQELGE